jgi:hypothetical protein
VTDPLKVTLLGAGMERNLLLARRQEWKYSRAALDTKDSPWVSKIRSILFFFYLVRTITVYITKDNALLFLFK